MMSCNRLKLFLILGLAFFSVLLLYVASIYENNASPKQMKIMERFRMIQDKINAKIVIYTKPTCMYCIRAKNFLKDMNLKYKEIDVSSDPLVHSALIEKTGSKTVPLIFINDSYIGGCSDMLEMAEDGRSEKILVN